MTRYVDLNADVGELEGPHGRGLDSALLNTVTSCNIACGGHAGDEFSMSQTLRAAAERGVACGAHPSYPDREGFGRRLIQIAPEQLRESLLVQLHQLKSQALAQSVSLRHVKAHGALYNAAAEDRSLAELLAQLTQEIGVDCLLGPPSSALSEAARAFDLQFIAEGFADRAYLPDGRLMPRTQPGAVLGDVDKQVTQALSIAQDRPDIETICVHGDTPGAQRAAQRIREGLEANGIAVRAR